MKARRNLPVMNDKRESESEREREQAGMWMGGSSVIFLFSLQIMCPGLMKFKVVSGFCLHQNGLDVAERV